MTTSTGVLGKIPAQGDFLRVNAAGPAARALDQWLAEGIEAQRRVGGKPPAQPVRFLFRAAAGEVLAGAFAPSRDSVCREFPLAVFTAVDARATAAHLGGVEGAFAPFWQGALRLCADAAALPGAEIAARAAALAAPGPLGEAHAAAAGVWRSAPAASMAEDAYAVSTLLAACGAARGGPAQKPVTLDCPAADAVARGAWLEGVRRALGWTEAPPSVFWTDAPMRMLVCLGPPPPPVLGYLARPEAGGQQLWPLTTKSADARSRAEASLSEPLRRALAGTVDAVLGALGGP